MNCLEERGRNLLMVRAVRHTRGAEEAKRLIADELPESLVSVLSERDADSLRQKLLQLPEPPANPSLTKDDILRAVGICFWVFASTFPVVVPFFFIGEVQPALRLSNAIAIVMLFMCGYAFARCTGLRAWPTGLLMVAIGCAMVGVANLFGG